MRRFSVDRIWTVLELIYETTGYFNKKAIASARLDAELLLAHCLGIDRIQLYIAFERPLTEAELSAFRELVRRRAAGEPVAYLTGYREFWSLKIRVRHGVLIPRPETELLVEEGIKMLKTCDREAAVLELGTGSGAIAVALAKEIKNSMTYATDISPSALAVARQNISEQGLQERIRLVCGNSLAPFRKSPLFDLIISNPPYICRGEIATLAVEIKDHEPLQALDGGDDGLVFYRQWIPHMPHLLRAGGGVILEIGAEQADAVSQLFRDAGFPDVVTEKDYAGHSRAVIARRA
jgi:release factor glutamine methyltransferase